ncbi:MAG: RecQ family ATP-dependent DNA helicase [Planctomycetota bacterium]
MATLRAVNPRAALKKHWGYDAFRPFQEDAVAAALAGRDSLVVLPTGGGKSVCFQIPAACGDGLVVVVSPLIALMDDQVAGAREAGISAGALHQNLNAAGKREVRAALDDGSLRLLYLSPERMVVGDLHAEISKRLSLVAIDEAHCISHWGHDFRPEYRQLAAALSQLPRVPRMALTATATPKVQDDICAQLKLADPLRLVGAIDRPNLVFRALPRSSAVEQTLEVVRRHPGDGGIVYAQTRKATEQLAASLVKHGVDARPYHAGMAAGARMTTVSDFTTERLQVVVATVAFGMGIDRSNVRFVVHANLPRSVEHYQQESGRAGRDGEPAECILLWGGQDFATWRYLARQETHDPERLRGIERQLAAIGRYASAPLCRHRLLSEHFGQTYTEQTEGCGACDVCLGETAALPPSDAVVTAQKILSAAWRTENRFGAGHISKVLRGASDEQVTRWGHDQLSVFGLLRDVHDTVIRRWIDQLVAQGHLMVDDGQYPTLSLSESGYALCKGQGDVRLDAPPAPRERKRATKKSKSAKGASTETSADQPLFERLRKLRATLAAAAGLPPYVVSTDAGLRAVCADRPATVEALANCHGWGEKRAARYGAAVLEEIKRG